MGTINHFESEIPCYRIAHDGGMVISVTFSAGRTSTRHQILTGDSWEDVVEKLDELEITLPEDLFLPEPEPEPDTD